MRGTSSGRQVGAQDARPWTRVVVTIFALLTASHAIQELGAVELKNGGVAMPSKTAPAFKIAVARVSPPPTMSGNPSQSDR